MSSPIVIYFSILYLSLWNCWYTVQLESQRMDLGLGWFHFQLRETMLENQCTSTNSLQLVYRRWRHSGFQYKGQDLPRDYRIRRCHNQVWEAGTLLLCCPTLGLTSASTRYSHPVQDRQSSSETFHPQFWSLPTGPVWRTAELLDHPGSYWEPQHRTKKRGCQELKY